MWVGRGVTIMYSQLTTCVMLDVGFGDVMLMSPACGLQECG